MKQSINKHTLFQQPRSKAESKADVTTSNARSIMDAEVKKREAKTQRLREARLALAASEDAPAAPAKKAARRPARKKAGA